MPHQLHVVHRHTVCVKTLAWQLPSSDNTTSALNVIIEAQVFVAHPVQDGKSLVGLEVLELDQAVGEAMLSSSTELIHHCHVLIPCQPFLLAALHYHTQHLSSIAQNDASAMYQALLCVPVYSNATANCISAGLSQRDSAS